MFSNYNKRFFTLNLEKLLFYYTSKAHYVVQDMKFIPLKVFPITFLKIILTQEYFKSQKLTY